DDGERTQDLGFTNLNHALINMKRTGSPWGMVIGITPYSSRGYDVSIEREQEIEGNTADLLDQYSGSGGINKALIGLSRKFSTSEYYVKSNKLDSALYNKHQLSLGINANYFFGNLDEVRRINFEDPNFLDARITADTRMQSFGFDIGFIYKTILNQRFDEDLKIDEKWELTVGGTYTPSMDWNTTFKEVRENVQQFSGVDFVVDTAKFISGAGFTTIPERITFGAAITHRGSSNWQWTLGGDIKLQSWSNSVRTLDGISQNLGFENSTMTSFGVTFEPMDYEDTPSIFHRTTYYLGARSESSYLSIGDNTVTDQAVSGGLSFPVLASGSATRINFGMEFGQRGSTDGILVQEQYFLFNFGVSLSPRLRSTAKDPGSAMNVDAGFNIPDPTTIDRLEG
ncbi:MAG: hypothetical protein AAF193_10665, partial [Bacteroidota bacterium]